MQAVRKDAGFTLLEVLVALVIVTLGLVSLYDALGEHYLQIARSNARQSTLAFAQSHLETVGTSTDIAPGVVDGQYDNGARWRLTMAPLKSQANATRPAAVPTLLILDAFDGRGRPMLRLKSVRLMRLDKS